MATSRVFPYLKQPPPMWECILCRAPVSRDQIPAHQKECIVELRIREIFREELERLEKSDD